MTVPKNITSTAIPLGGWASQRHRTAIGVPLALTVPRQWIVPAALFPQRILPMQPELASEPFHLDGWVWEEKYDGWRMIAY